MNLGWQMLMLPHGLIALSISTVIFPRMARLYEQGKTGEMRSVFTEALSPMLFLTIPAAIGLYEFRYAIVEALLQYGAFDAFDTYLVASAIEFLAFGLVFYALVEVGTRIFYAMKDTRTPVTAGVIIIVVNMVIGYALIDRLGHVGLAIGLTVSTAIEAFILFVILRRRVGGLSPNFGGWLGKVLLATAAMALMAEYVTNLLDQVIVGTDVSTALTLSMVAYAMVLVGATYFVAAWALAIPEATVMVRKGRSVAARVPVVGTIFE